MPELPEVETIKNLLIKSLIGKSISSVEVLRKNIVKSPLVNFENDLKNVKINNISRKGKFLIFHLSDNKVLLTHLRMEGKFYLLKEKEENSKYARIIFHLNNEEKVCYDDSRTFGMMYLSDEENYLNLKEMKKLGQESFDIKEINPLFEKIKKINKPIKRVLLDQSFISGIGNIYADEILYASKIHPLTNAKNISKDELITIIKEANRILSLAINYGGSTIKSFHPGKGIDGKFQNHIKIYGKRNEVCPICKHIFRFTKINGRGSTFCPGCQHKKGSPIHLAIYGKLGAGKSHALRYFASRNYPTLSADQIVKELYEKKEIKLGLEKKLKINFGNKNSVDKNILREHLNKHLEDKKKIENYIYPLVKKEILTFFKENKSPIIVVEVPLLFKQNFDTLFDTILAIDINDEEQLKRLKKRNPNSYISLMKINKNQEFENNKMKADFIIDNSYDRNHYHQELEKIANILKDRLN